MPFAVVFTYIFVCHRFRIWLPLALLNFFFDSFCSCSFHFASTRLFGMTKRILHLPWRNDVSTAYCSLSGHCSDRLTLSSSLFYFLVFWSFDVPAPTIMGDSFCLETWSLTDCCWTHLMKSCSGLRCLLQGRHRVFSYNFYIAFWIASH